MLDESRGDRHHNTFDVAYVDGHFKSTRASDLVKIVKSSQYNEFVNYTMEAGGQTCAAWKY